jgi:hypothetical protein
MIAKRIIVPAALTAALAVGGSVGLATTASAATPAPAAQSKTSAHAGAAWLRHHRRVIGRAVVTVSSKDIGVTRKNLVSELRSGKSIAQVAGEHGVSASTVETDLVHAADSEVSKLAGEGKLTSAQASKIEAALPGFATKVVNKTF